MSVQSRSPLAPLEGFWVGGFALLLFAFSSVFLHSDVREDWFVLGAWWLCFVVNFPHFLATYQVLYGDLSHRIRTDAATAFVAYGVPAILLLYCFFAVLFEQGRMLGWLVQAMFFTVGWHYTKQVYGVMVVLSGRRGVYFSARERFWTRANLLMVWLISFNKHNTAASNASHYNVHVTPIPIPAWVTDVLNWGFLATLTIALTLWAARYLKDKSTLTWGSWLAWTAMILWFVPRSQGSAFYAEMIPLLHSMQYLVFLNAYRANRSKALSPHPMRDHLSFWLTSALLGAAGFELIPRILDGVWKLDSPGFGTEPWMLMITSMINIHHYFIDSVIWKKSNRDVHRYLTSPSPALQDSKA